MVLEDDPYIGEQASKEACDNEDVKPLGCRCQEFSMKIWPHEVGLDTLTAYNNPYKK